MVGTKRKRRMSRKKQTGWGRGGSGECSEEEKDE